MIAGGRLESYNDVFVFLTLETLDQIKRNNVVQTKQPIVVFLLVNPCTGLLGDHGSFRLPAGAPIAITDQDADRKHFRNLFLVDRNAGG